MLQPTIYWAVGLIVLVYIVALLAFGLVVTIWRPTRARTDCYAESPTQAVKIEVDVVVRQYKGACVCDARFTNEDLGELLDHMTAHRLAIHHRSERV